MVIGTCLDTSKRNRANALAEVAELVQVVRHDIHLLLVLDYRSTRFTRKRLSHHPTSRKSTTVPIGEDAPTFSGRAEAAETLGLILHERANLSR